MRARSSTRTRCRRRPLWCSTTGAGSSWSDASTAGRWACGACPSASPRWVRPSPRRRCASCTRRRASAGESSALSTPIPGIAPSTATCWSSPSRWRRRGGSETPGDDADDVGYFPIDGLPPLAFPSNEKAIRLCADLHRDEWAIHDSFHQLGDEARAPGCSPTASSASSSEHAPLVARLWLADVRSSHTTPGYRRLEPDPLLAECTAGLQLLGRWLEGESTEEETKTFYRDLGARRRSQGVRLGEVLSALMLLKKHIWDVRPLPGRVAAARGDVPGDGVAEPLRDLLRQGHVPLGPRLRRGLTAARAPALGGDRRTGTGRRVRSSGRDGSGSGTGCRCRSGGYTLKRKLTMSPSATM